MTKSASATQNMLGSLISVFRSHGFEGASLSRFTERSGLIKASLYHRFPAGKEQMALAALAEVARIFATHILVPVDAEGNLQDRLKLIAQRLDAFYEGGTQACLLETLSGPGTPASVRIKVGEMLDFWVSKFAQLATQAGFSAQDAQVRAQGAVAAIEGALVVSRAQGSSCEFERSLESLAGRLLAL